MGHTRDRYELESLQFVVIQKQNVTKPTNWNRYSKRFPVGGLYMGYLRLGIAFVCLFESEESCTHGKCVQAVTKNSGVEWDGVLLLCMIAISTLATLC